MTSISAQSVEESQVDEEPDANEFECARRAVHISLDLFARLGCNVERSIAAILDGRTGAALPVAATGPEGPWEGEE